MICVYAETQLSNLTFFLYTFIRIIQSLLAFLIDPHRPPINNGVGDDHHWDIIDLPVCQFQDLINNDDDQQQEEEEMRCCCSICLMEFANEEMVNKLPRCGHVFHVGCLDRWLDRCRFTCPLCRSFLLKIRSPHHCTTTTTAVNGNHHDAFCLPSLNS